MISLTDVRVGLVDYRAGNLFSIENAFDHLGVDVFRVAQPEDLDEITHLVLPGVGAFAHCAANLANSGLVPALERWAMEDRRPILGICVGMQLMATCGFEYERCDGLGWIDGEIRPLTGSPPDNRVPHVGWSEVAFRSDLGSIRAGASLDFYFDHSYAFTGVSENRVVGVCAHTAPFPAIVRRDNIVATQFHPEKSQRAGLMLLQAFLAMDPGDG